MDAQNAADADSSRPAGASPKPQDPSQRQSQPQHPTASKDTDDRKPAASVSVKASSPVKEGTNALAPASSTAAADDAPPQDRDSDAETIVLPGKDGHSPSKIRKVRQEDRSESDGDAIKAVCPPNPSSKDGENLPVANRTDDDIVKRKRLPGGADRDRQLPRRKDVSSGLSSAPTSPPHLHQQSSNRHHPQQQQHSHHQRRRRSDDGPSSLSDSEHSQHKSSKSVNRDKIRLGERLLPNKRKAPNAESDDEAHHRQVRRQRTTSTGLDSTRPPRDSKPALKPHHESRHRSTSPQPRHHRRSASTQLPSQSSNGLAQKKKRLPPPLQPTDYHSDDSSASGSPHPRTAKLRSLATPATADSNMSPAKIAPHKKHLDAHGQTLLARACARHEYDAAKQRLGERPEDLNVADYAGNTPLQIAAINGCEDIVKLLIEAGCNLDCVNYDKDTPLLDAVDNGHLGVVKLLLGAGVNPRKANVNGQEPIDRVSEETENADEIRNALLEARKRAGERRRTSEDRHSHNDGHETRDSHAPDSPRHSPAAASSGTGRRGGTIRATKTRNDLLYMPLDEKTLRQAAGRGDEATVARILQVREGYDDPESMVAAARGGHDLVIQLLLGLGSFNPDPAPVSSLPSEVATPILAAIGQENIKVVELLLGQQGFDPTRRFKGETYYEIASRRQGPNWKDEEHMLKNAYDEYKRSHKETMKTKSPGRREREREEKRTRREEAKEESKSSRRTASSPTRDPELRRKANSKLSSPREAKRADPSHADENHKRGPGRPRKEDKIPSINVSDREVSPTMSHKALKNKRAESDLVGASSEGEAAKPRKRLVSKGELRGERDKHRRSSMASNTTSTKEPASPRDSRAEEAPEKHKLSEKYHDRTKALKRDDSRDRLSVSGDGSTKRHRNSVTPDRPNNGDKDDEAPVKKRRLEQDGSEKRIKRPVSAEGRSKNGSARDASNKLASKNSQKDRDSESRSHTEGRDHHRRESGKSSASDRSIHVKSEDVDVEMPDVDSAKEAEEAEARAAKEAEEEMVRKKRKKKLAEADDARREEERQRADAEEKKKKREQEEARKREEEEQKRKKEEAEKELKRKQKEEQDRKAQEQADRERREAEEAARRLKEEEEKRRLEDEARKQEEARKEEARRKEEEEERKRREEEERLRKEQLEREAAEEARRQREEAERKEQERKDEERKERERREKAHREDMERKRAAREAEQRRLREEAERVRVDKLPPLVRWLETCANPRTASVAEKLRHIQGVRYDTIRPQWNNTAKGREQWVLNTDVALLLGEKDLDLSRYTAWDHVTVTPLAKKSLWRTEASRYALTNEKFWEFGLQMPGYYGEKGPQKMGHGTIQQLRTAAWARFRDTDMFFVKLSDFLYTTTTVPHLRNIKLAVEYREIAESEAQWETCQLLRKWKHDPDAARFHGFAPRNRYFVNGSMVGEDLPTVAQTSKTPFIEKRVPRRGLVQVYPDDPDYTRICLEQGLEHLVKGRQSTPLANGVHSPAMSHKSLTSTGSNVNGNSTQKPETASLGELTNGINGDTIQNGETRVAAQT